MIRGEVYMVDFGKPRGHELGYRHPGIVISPDDTRSWSVVTVIPTSTHAQTAIFRPTLEIAGRETVVLVDQIRTIDTMYVGDWLDYLPRDELAAIEFTVARYLGLKTE